MTTISMDDVVTNFVNELQGWANRQVFQNLVQAGSNPANEILLKAYSLAHTSPDTDFQVILGSLRSLKNKKSIFSESKPYLYLYAKITAARACVDALRNNPGTGATTISRFKMLKTNIDLDHHSFYFSDNTTYPNSKFAYINFSTINEQMIDTAFHGTSTEFPFKFLSAPNAQGKIFGCKVVCVDENVEIPEERMKSSIQMVLARNGHSFHKPAEYNGVSVVRQSLSVDIAEPFEQFDDVLQVLSQANHDKDILDKFLRFYQILENFMVRRQVVKVQRSSGANKFSIREFQRLYDAVKKTELEALKDLVDSCASIITQPISTQTLVAHIKGRWNTLLTNCTNVPELEAETLRIYGPCPKNGITFDANQYRSQLNSSFGDALSAMIYRTRNSIVHNKEHEFHLTHFNLSGKIKDLLEAFLIPSMEDLIFALILQDRQIVWYANSTIRLHA